MKAFVSHPKRRRAFSLLEVILALAIFTGALAVLGELASLGMRNARVARYLAHAQLLCESQLAEITSGITPADNVSSSPLESGLDTSQVQDESDIAWVYSVEVEQADIEGLLSVRVTVTQDLPPEKQPVSVSLVRLIVDPELTSEESTTSNDSGSTSDTGGGSSRG